MNGRYIRRALSLLLLLTGGIRLPAQTKIRAYIEDSGRPQRAHNVDMLHMKLQVSFRPEEGLVTGRVTHTFKTLQKQVDSLFLDAPDIRVSEAELDGKKVRTVSTQKGLIFYFDPMKMESVHKLYISYDAHPKKGIYFIGWKQKELPDDNPDHLIRKQIWTQGQGIDNRHWFPCYDGTNDKLTTETIIRFDSGYAVKSNGVLISKKNFSDGTTAWHYKMSKPHVPYLVMIAIGDYKIKQIKSKSGIPIDLYYYPEWEDRVQATYKYSARMMDFFERETGFPYPWESYAIIPVQEFLYGAMENTTATIYGDFYHVDQRQYLDKNFVAVNAHELAHQWFGDCVTARSEMHHWLQESFATHYNMMWEGEVFGQDHLAWKRRQAAIQSLKASEKDNLPVAHSKAGSVRIYPKGGTVLFMLKYIIGHELFVKGIKDYLTRHAYGNVDTHDLQESFEEVSGMPLDWFFDEWIYRGSEPHYKVDFRDIQIGKGNMRYSEFRIEQTQQTDQIIGLFKMPFVFRVVYKDGTREEKKVWIEKQTEIVSIPNRENKEIAFALFDPNSQVMKEAVFDKPIEMLQAQALQAEYMLDRYDAIVAMRHYKTDVKRETLIKAFEHETFHAIRSEILNQLMQDEDPSARHIIMQAINTGDAKVKYNLIQHTKAIPAELLPGYEKLLSDSSYRVVEAALRLLCMENPSGTEKYLEQTKEQVGTVGSNVRVTWLEMAAWRTADREHTDRLVLYTSNQYEFRTRVYAAQALKRLDYFDVNLMHNLFDAVCNSNKRLANPCSDVLRYFFHQDKHRIMILRYYRQGKWNAYQAGKLKHLFD